MERKAKVVCSVVGFLGLLSAALGFAAEAKRIKASQIQITSSSTCIYPSSPALGLGLAAVVALMIAQTIISIATGCFCCCRRGSYQSNSNSRVGVICFVISWITFFNALRLLLSGIVLNNRHMNEYFGNSSCYFVKPGVFAGGAVLSLATVVLGIVCYLAWDSAKISNNLWVGNGTAAAPNQGGIAMGHPQFPPPQYPPPQYPQPHPSGPPPQYPPTQYPPPNAEAPVFVHEDTYMRRQFT